jgi:lipopolysaccharide export system protein LptA
MKPLHSAYKTMNRLISYSVLFSFCLASIAASAVATKGSPASEVVTIESGKLQGATADGVLSFKGMAATSNRSTLD